MMAGSAPRIFSEPLILRPPPRGSIRPRPTGRSSPRPRPEARGAVRAPVRDQRLAKAAGDVVGKEFGGRVGDRQQGTFVAGEAPGAVAVADPPVRSLLGELDQGALGGQEHPVVELVDDPAGQVLERDEVEDVMVLVELVFHLDGRPIVMAVDSLALAAGVGDEVARAEDQVILGDTDLVTRTGHGWETPESTHERSDEVATSRTGRRVGVSGLSHPGGRQTRRPRSGRPSRRGCARGRPRGARHRSPRRAAWPCGPFRPSRGQDLRPRVARRLALPPSPACARSACRACCARTARYAATIAVSSGCPAASDDRKAGSASWKTS